MAKPNLPAEILKQRRLDLGLTQAGLADRAGIEQSQVSKIERNLDVRLSTLMKLLTALDLDLLLAPRIRSGPESPIHATSRRSLPKAGTLLERFAIPDEEDDTHSPRLRKK
jgi:transcriptional regulator with XRE-family HTH domain